MSVPRCSPLGSHVPGLTGQFLKQSLYGVLDSHNLHRCVQLGRQLPIQHWKNRPLDGCGVRYRYHCRVAADAGPLPPVPKDREEVGGAGTATEPGRLDQGSPNPPKPKGRESVIVGGGYLEGF